MPSQAQRVEAGHRRYVAGAPLQRRNRSLVLAKRIGAARAVDKGVEKFVALERVTTVADYCNQDDKCNVQVERHDREPFLLIPDVYNDGEFLPLAIYGCAGVEPRSGLCEIDVHAGSALMRPDTLVYWT